MPSMRWCCCMAGVWRWVNLYPSLPLWNFSKGRDRIYKLLWFIQYSAKSTLSKKLCACYVPDTEESGVSSGEALSSGAYIYAKALYHFLQHGLSIFRRQSTESSWHVEQECLTSAGEQDSLCEGVCKGWVMNSVGSGGKGWDEKGKE